MVNVSSIPGCCAAYNFYNIGNAHGYSRAKNFDDFVGRFREKNPNRVNICFLNQEQTQEAIWLERMGWKKVDQTQNISLFVISGDQFRKFFIDYNKNKLKDQKLEKVTLHYVRSLTSYNPTKEQIKFFEEVFSIKLDNTYHSYYDLFYSIKARVAIRKMKEKNQSVDNVTTRGPLTKA